MLFVARRACPALQLGGIVVLFVLQNARQTNTREMTRIAKGLQKGCEESREENRRKGISNSMTWDSLLAKMDGSHKLIQSNITLEIR